MEKYTENMHQKLVPELHLFLVKSAKYSQCTQETFSSEIFERGLSEIP